MQRFKKASDIKVGVIGYGGQFNMGRAHLQQMAEAGMTPVAVAEIDPDRQKQAAEDFPGIQTFPSVDKMLKNSDINLTTIITPHNTHARLALQCLRADCHVVCEKPLAITTAECDRMMREAKARNLVLSTYHNRHWDGCILQAMKSIISKNEIGEVVRIEAHMGNWGCPRDWWRASKSISGGILYDWGVHLLEYALQILGNAKITEVCATAHTGYWAEKTAWKDDSIEDEGFVLVRFDSGQWVTLNISNLDSNPKEGWLEITGTSGSYVFDGGAWKIIRHAKGIKTVKSGSNPPDEREKFYRNIADHLTGKAPLVITPEWARRPIHILDLADRSASRGAAIKAKIG